MADQLALSLIFFVSGAAGLIFEMVWFYRSGLVFGNSIWAASIVLSSFMGGLALGNGLVGRYRRHLTRPFGVYAAAEIVIAVTGVALTLALPASTRLIGLLTRSVVGLWSVNLIRLLTAFVLLLVPATAMGTTLPLLVGAADRGGERFGIVLGRLYGWNTLGAVSGLIGAEIVLIHRFGVTGTAWIAGLLDVAAGAAAFQLSRRDRGKAWLARALGPSRADLSGDARNVHASGIWLNHAAPLLVGAFLAGGNLLALEVIWFRFLSMFVLTTTVALSLMLAVVLAAIAVGALAGSMWLARFPGAVRSLPAVALTAACAVVISYGAFQSLTSGTQVGEWLRILWFVCVLTLPTAFLSGLLFTWFGEALYREIAARTATPGTPSVDTQTAAWLTLANTTGAMCGSPVAVFLLLPVLGMERALFTVALIYAIIGAIVVKVVSVRARGSVRRQRVVVPVTVVAVVAVVVIVVVVRFPFGLMHDNYFNRAAEAYSGDGSTIVATREGPAETIFLMQQRWLGHRVYDRLVTNGFSMSGTAIPAMRYMRDFVYLPMVLHKAPLARVLVVCYGIGVTAGAATDVPSVESIDIVEISRDVAAMSDLIYPPDRHPLHDPRVRLHFEDGRQFLETTREQFDLVTGEPPPPRTPGAVNIYTREYFQLIYDRLREGGITSYWLPVGRPSPGTDVNTIIRGFCDVFQDCSLWNATPFDLILVGTRHGVGPVVEGGFVQPWTRPALASRLIEVGFERPHQIGATFIGDERRLRELTAGTPPLTDDYPQRLRPDPKRPSLSDPRYGVDAAATDQYQQLIDPARARQVFITSDFIRRMLPEHMIEETLPFFEEQRIINRVLWEGGKPLRLIEDLDLVLRHTTLKTLALWILGSDAVKQRIGMSSADVSGDGAGTTDYVRGLEALATRDYLGAAAAFTESERRGFRGVTVRPLLVYALCRGGRADAAARLAPTSEPRDGDEAHFWNWLRGSAACVP